MKSKLRLFNAFLFSLFLWLNMFSHSFAQGINNLWMMGYDNSSGIPWGGTNIDFSSGVPIISYMYRPMSISSSNALISNSQGNLLFYTNGIYIANANNNTMLNGAGLNPSSYTTQRFNDGLSITQSDIIIPFPGDSMKYYLFHVTLDSAIVVPVYLYYTIVDMTLDNGLGGVVSKNNILIHQPLEFGGLTACKHANGRDWWLICHENSHYYTNNTYLKFLITPQGIQGPFTQSIGKLHSGGVGQVVFSQDGTKFANYESIDDLDVMNFDRCSGDFSNCIHVAIDDSASFVGAAFSPNSQVLYASSIRYVYQFDMTSSNIPASKTTVAVWDSFFSPNPPFATTFFLSQLAPDGKIYINCSNGTLDMHVINYPDSLGLACDVCQHCVHLPTYNAETIPNYPNYFLGADTTSAICDTLSAIQSLAVRNSKVTVFPNPTSRILYAALNGVKIKSAKIFNAFGQEVLVNYSFINNGEYLEVNTASLSQGIYFLELLSEKEKVVKKFVKE